MKQIIYITLAKNQEIEVWKLHDDFSLNLLQRISTQGEPQPIIISKDKKYLYIGVRPKFKVYSYKIKADGTLTKHACSTLPGSPNHFEIDHTGKYLFSSSYHFNCLSITPLDTLGIPRPVTQTIKNIFGCHASKMNCYNTCLFISALKKDCIYAYNFKKNGKLLKNTRKNFMTNVNFGPRHLDLQKCNNRLYSVNELNGSVDIWSINSFSNELILLKNINIMSKNYCNAAWSSDLHISPCEKFLYVSDRIENTISIIKLEKDVQNIEKIGHIKTELQPRTFSINSTGENLIVVGEKSNSFSVYKISKITGLLELKNTYSTGNRPVWISSLML
ncbi:conserved hypothetical protein [Buchnera aphidicola str. Bp (Baizongia pistaciae)]|uniref:6-phosphogluconolactonase n=1 Tax=Buchnera aphidicola subsp. Baizongia pistaciae (strain Bp) TaxID=224915 RepID=6PGL_BUCBP|nr:6-phosphogluconolactonase [Buchnera aphidicola]Q89AK3.1 RecName: Full=6-phosphogluconolactonase; Short=6-P-gluconolactonase [Buchnera aphidicola str. Bp (Baizongia pistaciae)]AAO26999.1 conserved hypothetical protein [Buchnera aphidicola str. Bp (Baizongia pistaciae)]